jgi:uncharacterized protein DUF2846
MKIPAVATRKSIMFVSSTIIVTIVMAVSVLAQNKQAPSESQGACGPKEVRFDALTTSGAPLTLQDGKALVYVSEVFKKVPGEFGNPTIRIGLDGAWMGATRSNSYIAFSVDPGEHHLCTNWQSHFKRLSREAAFAGFAAEAGKTYYFRARIGYETVGTATTMTLDLDPVDPDEGKYLVASNPASTSHPQK